MHGFYGNSRVSMVTMKLTEYQYGRLDNILILYGAEYCSNWTTQCRVNVCCGQGGRHILRSVSYGILRVRQPVSHMSVPMRPHRAACIVKFQTVPLPSNLDASHLCGHSMYFKPDHLSLEPYPINNNRIHCHGILWCSGHGKYPNCILYMHKQGTIPIKYYLLTA